MKLGTNHIRPEIITRSAARALGRVHFYTGVACKREHLALRYVSTGNCCACSGDRSATKSDMRKVPRVIRLRFVAGATAEKRRALHAYITQCVAAFEAAHAPRLGSPGAGEPLKIVDIVT